MTDTVDALARAIDANWVHLLRPLGGQPEGVRDSAAAILAALTAEGLSIVKTAEWERAQRVEHAAADVDGLWFPQDDNWTGTDLTFWGPEAGEALRDLRTALEQTP